MIFKIMSKLIVWKMKLLSKMLLTSLFKMKSPIIELKKKLDEEK